MRPVRVVAVFERDAKELWYPIAEFQPPSKPQS